MMKEEDRYKVGSM